MKQWLLAVSAVSLVAPGLAAQEPVLAFTGARIIPVSGAAIENGTLVVQGSRIVAVGRAGSVAVPAGATTVDVRGKVIMPGLVDSHSHIGQGDGGDRSSPMHPSVRLLDGIDVRSDNIKRARAGGITSVNVMPGSGHLMSGQTLYLKLRDGRTVEEMLLICKDPQTEICGGMKMANGTNPRGQPPFPGTRSKAAAIVREKYVKAVEYRDKLRAAATDSTKRPPRDLEMEALVQVLDRKRVVHHHTHRHDDILTVLRLAREFGFKVVLHHVSEAWKVADQIAASGAAASVIVLDSPGGKQEAIDVRNENGAVLDKAGVLTGFHTDDGITDSRFFLRSAALAVRAGMPRDRALAALTINNARILDIADRVGTLEPGKDADFLVLSGDPLSVYTHVEQTWVEGRKLFDRAIPEQRKYQVGGAGVFNDRTTHDDEWHDREDD